MSPSETKRPIDAETASRLQRARAFYVQHAWAQAYDVFATIDRDASNDQGPPLAIEDLERLASSAGLTGRDDELVKTLERVYRAALEIGDTIRAARSAYWCGSRLNALREPGRASGWFARCERIADGEAIDGVARAYALLVVVSKSLAAGELDTAHEGAVRAASIAERFGEADALAFARNMQGRALVRLGKIAEGIAVLDESMLAAATGELSPVVAALIYCTVIATCHRVYALDRAREWTGVLSDWCDAQPELVTFRGICMVHRAEILQLGGDWSQSIEQARRASAGAPGAQDMDAGGDAHYQEGEIHRLRGDVEAAEASYKAASQLGREPQPGLALLRLALGQLDAAASGIRRLLSETKDPLLRAKLLPAAVEILIAVDAKDDARSASRELEEIATRFDTEAFGAIAAHARAKVHLAEGDAQAALGPLRRAFWVWQKIGAPHAMARTRVDLGRACEALGDHEGSKLELEAARSVFALLGAGPDLAALEALKRGTTQGSHGLTPRELEVLRLVAAGKTNKGIAKELFLSEKTVDRHVSNIFTKVNVSSRAAATAFAYENRLI